MGLCALRFASLDGGRDGFYAPVVGGSAREEGDVKIWSREEVASPDGGLALHVHRDRRDGNTSLDCNRGDHEAALLAKHLQS
jgi:hypothetical protein